MAEKLSQSQIDALLSAVRSGEKDLTESPDETAENKYRKYDFNSPRKFTKDRIKILQSIYDSYARIVNTRLNGRLRTNCDIAVESVEEQHYYEFANALGEGDVLAMSRVEVKGVQEDEMMRFHISTPTVLSMMDRLMGGEGEVDTELPDDYTYTDLELHLYEEIVQDLIDVMGNGWESYVPIQFIFDHVDVNPTMSQTSGLDEIVVIVDMTIQFPNLEGKVRVCLPGEMLSNVFTIIANENPTKKANVEKKSDEIFDSLRDSELEIVAELGHTQLSLRDVYHLNVGDVIDIGTSKDSDIFLEIGGYRWFSGRMGTYKKNLAVKIDSVYQTE